MTFDDKVAYFKAKQIEIINAGNEFKRAEAALTQEYNEKLAAERNKVMRLVAPYRAELKEWIGITDGEPADVLDTLVAFKKVLT